MRRVASMISCEPAFIGNFGLVTDRFGSWPSFHDSEILRIELSRSLEVRRPNTVLRMDIYVFISSPEIDARGYYKLENPSVVSFLFEDIDDLDIEDFNHQNVIEELLFSRIVDGRIEVKIHSIFGLFGSFSCSEVLVTAVKPWSH